MPSPNRSNRPSANPGPLGEALVAQWWREQGGLILAERWHCRWGELDLVIGQPSPTNAMQPVALAFVEVKTRSRGNWDSDGALAIDQRKQAKLWQAAQLFLVNHSHWADLPCRFDVALVRCQLLMPGKVSLTNPTLDAVTTIASGYRLTLQSYIMDAFTLE